MNQVLNSARSYFAEGVRQASPLRQELDMTCSSTYLFYDLETSGLNPAFDQILQFAAIRTDEDFREIARHEFRIRLRPDIIPSPGALLATDVPVLKAVTTGRCEYDAIREIHSLINQPNTTNVGYNSISFDDQFLRFAFYRNLLPAYHHQYKNNCRRLDIFPITVLYWLQNSPLLNWPLLDNNPTLKLEHLSRENDLAEGQAHDALVDVAATVELARRLRRDKVMWQNCLDLFDKTTYAIRLTQLPIFLERPYALLIHGKFGYDRNCQVPALYLGESNNHGNRSLWLRLDKPELTQTTPANIAETTWVIRIKAGEPPFMMPPEPHKLNEEQRQIAHNNLKWLMKHPDILPAIMNHYQQDTFAEVADLDIDAALYANGFPSAPTESLIRRFHQADLPQKMSLIKAFPDDVTRELAIRLLCRNNGLAYRYPSYQAYQQRVCDDERPLPDYRGNARLTPQAALAEIEVERQGEVTPRRRGILDDLEQYIRYQFGRFI